jgi:valyl-tRNA synthetase
VEIAKEQLKNEETRAQTIETLARVFDVVLRLLHPYTPFVTEEIWEHLRNVVLDSPLKDIVQGWPEALIVAKWPEPREPEAWEEQKIADFALLIQDPIRANRNFHAEKNIKTSQKHGMTYVNKNKAELLRQYLPIISALSSTDLEQSFVYEEYKPSEAVTALIVGTTEIYPNVSGLERSEEDKARLEKELREAESHVQRLEKLLAGDFADKAPAHLVAKEREKLAGYQEMAEKIRAQLK